MPANPVIIPALKKHTATIIFSHGLGDTSAGWVPLAQALRHKHDYVKWVLPTAPVQPVTCNGGYKMTSWFDIQELPAPGDPSPIVAEDEKGMLASVGTINKLISDEVDAGIPSERVIVGGFSQGAVIAYLTGIISERKLGGIVALSGFLGMASKVKSGADAKSGWSDAQMKTDHAHKLPVFHGHGTADPVVQFPWGKTTVEKLRSDLGFEQIEFKTYPGMGHSFCEEEQADLEKWLQKNLPPV
ncbi:hypothetical protein JCM8097_000907 [Rhodosporidiobolus ruineniae]